MKLVSHSHWASTAKHIALQSCSCWQVKVQYWLINIDYKMFQNVNFHSVSIKNLMALDEGLFQSQQYRFRWLFVLSVCILQRKISYWFGSDFRIPFSTTELNSSFSLVIFCFHSEWHLREAGGYYGLKMIWWNKIVYDSLYVISDTEPCLSLI